MAKKVAKNDGVQIGRDEFMEEAKPLRVSIGDSQTIAMVKEFSSGSLGWYTGEKVIVNVGGTPVKCQVSLSIVVVGSKP